LLGWQTRLAPLVALVESAASERTDIARAV